jgi:uncharacterized protein YbbC (DUF1343 family)/CubicO group peptidase (beta-lactamase class C family)
MLVFRSNTFEWINPAPLKYDACRKQLMTKLSTLLLLFCSTAFSFGAAFNRAKLADIDWAITNAIAEGRLPGGVFWLERKGEFCTKAHGHRALLPKREIMTTDTIFDAASLTKVVACTPAVMLLAERGKIRLDDTVQTYIPEFVGDGKETITIRQLLNHTSGLRPDVDTQPPWKGYDTAIQMACAEKLHAEPGTVFRYSDINFFLLGDVVKRVAGMPLNEFVTREIFAPLKMKDTGYLPPKSKLARVAPTETNILRGVVHDPTARYMGGVAGHAGLFITAADLARFARMMLNEGELEGVRIFKPETVRQMTTVQTPEGMDTRRGFGWDIDTGYSRPRGKLFPVGSYGHTGFTGNAMWIDPFSETFWILLSNRVHPDGKGNVLPLQLSVATFAAMAVDGFDYANISNALPARSNMSNSSVRRAEVLNGIDVLVKKKFVPLKKLKIGLITNHTGIDRERKPTIDILKEAPEVELKALFSPEHGIRGQQDEKVSDSVDEKTGLPIYSLYGVRRSPAPEQLKGLDALVFDIQDIGCRFYTYVSTMGLCMEAAAKAGIKFVVLDRVNPINGISVEGPVHNGDSTFVAFHSIPLRHGMTVGELARMFNAERGWNAQLSVIPIEGWRRDMWFDQTGLPWINPSPNMRSLIEATLYPGVGLHESALSVGRGTGTPFEVIGAPYINDLEVAHDLNRASLPGITFLPIRFTPTASTFKDKACGGVSMLITDRQRLKPVDVGITIGLMLQRRYTNDYALSKTLPLLTTKPTLEAIKRGDSLIAIKQSWAADLEAFKKRREPFLLYK